MSSRWSTLAWLRPWEKSSIQRGIERYHKELEKDKDQFEVLRKLHISENSTQRILSNQLGFSLGKLNYCIKALKQKGLIKYQNFKKSKNKKGYIYVLTPKGITHKTKLTINFIKRKME